MRDIIWTLIVIWLVYRLVDAFRTISAKRSAQRSDEPSASSENTAMPNKRDLKTAMRKQLNKEGEYVDFEELK